MATLVSPGVSVDIVDESYYGSSGPGTVPLLVIATAANKASPTGTGIAPGTVPSQANVLQLLTSQRDLIQTFGYPQFKTVEGTPVHGYETNEYGLHAAYQYLGISNRAYVLRADVDLDQLEPSETAPQGLPVAGTYWLDTVNTIWGLFKSNGNAVPGSAWVAQTLTVINSTSQLDNNSVPLSSIGANGDYAVVTATTANAMYEKVAGTWYEIGTNAWKAAHPTVVTGTVANPTLTAGNSIVINGVTVTLSGTTVAQTVFDINGSSLSSTITASASNNKLVLTHTGGGSITLANGTGTPLTTLGLTAGTIKGVTITYAPHTQVPAGSVPGDIWIKTTTPNKGANWALKFFSSATNSFVNLTSPLYVDDNAALAAFGGAPAIGTTYIQYNVAPEGSNATAAFTPRRWNGTSFEALVYEAQATAPSSPPDDGTLWYNTNFQVDVMYGNGQNWLGYRRKYPNTDPKGVILSGSAPLNQSDGTPLVDQDLWIDTSDLENYPALYRYNATTRKWTLVDKTDQTTPFGIVFADARADSGTTFTGIANANVYQFGSTETADLVLSDFVDPDAPDARTFPDGMLLFNTRFSTYNVKKYFSSWFAEGGFDPNTDFSATTYTVGGTGYTFPALTSTARWVTDSGNKVDGSPYMGRKAQRIEVVRALQAAIVANDDLRSEFIFYNLMACPGYPECIDEMVLLNTDIKEIAFIVADTPSRLAPTGTAITKWATNANNAAGNGEDGLITHSPYIGVYYPWGLSTNIDGSDVMVPPSTIALRTIAYNDQVAYPWYAPAGFRRGLVSNASSIGYLTSEGEFKATILNQGQRDVLYTNNINPIAFIPNRGLVVYGQKTLNPLTSALDRVDVARLANYLKYQLDQIVKPFLFEKNNAHTRDAARVTVERFLMGLVGLDALYDFAVLCDDSNNTPERIDRNELWIDVLIKPQKSIEFIFLPVRIKATGDTLSQ